MANRFGDASAVYDAFQTLLKNWAAGKDFNGNGPTAQGMKDVAALGVAAAALLDENNAGYIAGLAAAIPTALLDLTDSLNTLTDPTKSDLG